MTGIAPVDFDVDRADRPRTEGRRCVSGVQGLSSITLFTADTGEEIYAGLSFDNSSLVKVDGKIQPGVFLSSVDARLLAEELNKVATDIEKCLMHDGSGFKCALRRGHGGECMGLGELFEED